MASHNELGKKGEAVAQHYLQDKGYQILETNWRFEKSEVDIICEKDHTLVFVEVKTRATAVHGYPEEAITKKKQEKLLEAAEQFIELNQIQGEIRFDVISIITKNNQSEIFHIEDAFFPYQE